MVTNAVRCVPPRRTSRSGPRSTECRPFLAGANRGPAPAAGHASAWASIAHDSLLRGLWASGWPIIPSPIAARAPGRRGCRIWDSYHCSRYNTQYRPADARDVRGRSLPAIATGVARRLIPEQGEGPNLADPPPVFYVWRGRHRHPDRCHAIAAPHACIWPPRGAFAPVSTGRSRSSRWRWRNGARRSMCATRSCTTNSWSTGCAPRARSLSRNWTTCPIDRPVIFSAHGVPKSVPAEAERRQCSMSTPPARWSRRCISRPSATCLATGCRS